MEQGGQHEEEASHPRTDHSEARRRRQAAQRGRGTRRGLPAARDRRVDLAPLEGPIRRHEGQRREAPEGARDRERSIEADRRRPDTRHRDAKRSPRETSDPERPPSSSRHARRDVRGERAQSLSRGGSARSTQRLAAAVAQRRRTRAVADGWWRSPRTTLDGAGSGPTSTFVERATA